MMNRTTARSTILALVALATISGAATVGLAGTAEAATARPNADSIDNIVNSVDTTRDWCNGMGCADHERTVATLHIVYTYVEQDDGSIVAKPASAYLAGETTTWTDLKLQGFHGTTQVTLGPAYFQSPQFTYGVDGQWIPSGVGSHRVDSWQVPVPLSTALTDRASKGGTMFADFWHS